MIRKKSTFVTLRCTPPQRRLFRRVAVQRGLRLSEWIRSLCERDVAQFEAEHAALAARLERLGDA